MKMKKFVYLLTAAMIFASTSAQAADWPFFKNNPQRTGSSEANNPAQISGKIEWTVQTSQRIHSSPTVYKNKIYYGTKDGTLNAIDLNTGNPVWTFSETDNWLVSSPAAVNGRIYIGGYDTNLYCFNAENGDLIWQFTTSNSIQSSPAVDSDTVYFGSDDGFVYAVSVETGWEKWKFETDSAVTGSPVVA
ncbi:MAG: PQQ-like beta-propeller repeat protein, partial [Synergistes sp.]|nr:PQQ-like beta-propeller repeat protein [Synergistes sp.]